MNSDFGNWLVRDSCLPSVDSFEWRHDLIPEREDIKVQLRVWDHREITDVLSEAKHITATELVSLARYIPQLNGIFDMCDVKERCENWPWVCDSGISE